MGRRIFLVDDDPDFLSMALAEVLRHPLLSDAQVVLARSGREAVGLFADRGAAGDVAIVDCHLGDISGRDVVEAAPAGLLCQLVSSGASRPRLVDDGVRSKLEFSAVLDRLLAAPRRG